MRSTIRRRGNSLAVRIPGPLAQETGLENRSPIELRLDDGRLVIEPLDTAPVKGYPFEVELPQGLPVRGVILSDRVTTVDWRSCSARIWCSVPDKVVTAVQERLLPLIA